MRLRPATFAGTFITLLVTVAIVSACGILLEGGARAGVPPVLHASFAAAVPALGAAATTLPARRALRPGTQAVAPGPRRAHEAWPRGRALQAPALPGGHAPGPSSGRRQMPRAEPP
ncbi:hypothetical protein AB0I68_08850 [Streptomyces sp. NPDC050448]|uniref:hypothetical protein n=1 Tax=Streptomyces sp. NPDC050448 TaxID=3155404 RepID=UPI0034363F28